VAPDSEAPIALTVGAFKFIGDHLKVYSSRLEDHLEQTLTDLLDPYNYDSLAITQDNIDLPWGLSTLYPETLRASLFVATWSYFEALLTGLCKQLQELQGHALSLNELASDGVARALTYLRKIAALHMSNEASEKLKFLNKLRNCVVHSASHVSQQNIPLFQEQVEKWNYRSLVEISDDGRLRLSRDFCPTVIDVLNSFLDELRANNTRFAP
jgi:hypothetical protein